MRKTMDKVYSLACKGIHENPREIYIANIDLSIEHGMIAFATRRNTIKYTHHSFKEGMYWMAAEKLARRSNVL